MQIIECNQIKEKEIERLKKCLSSSLTLVIIQIGKFEENELYLRSKGRLAKELGVEIQNLVFDEHNSEEEIKEKIRMLNQEKLITGIMIQKPILSAFCYQELIDCIDPLKDIESLTTKNKEKWSEGRLLPCTARAILKILEQEKGRVSNQKIALLGKSDLIGKPLYEVLKQENHVFLCDSKTKDIKEIIKNADIVITAIGKANYFTKNYFKDGQFIIDASTSYLDKKLVGDVKIEDLEDLDVKITKVPGGVGLLTPIYLFDNLYIAHQNKNQ